MSEEFDSWELKLAAFCVMTLPILLVQLSFWAIIFIDYKKQSWRCILLPIEGPLKLVLVLYASFTSFAWMSAKATMGKTYLLHRLIAKGKKMDDGTYTETRLTKKFKSFSHYLYYKEETEKGTEIVDEEVVEDEFETKFYQRGLTNLLIVSTNTSQFISWMI